jgi:hypothetical protein
MQMTDGEFLDRFGDMLSPSEIVAMLDRVCWSETLVGIYQILERRFRDDPAVERLLEKDLSDIDPGAFTLVVGDDGAMTIKSEDGK